MPPSAPGPTGRVDVEAGICGYHTVVRATKTEGYRVRVTIESECPHVSTIGTEVEEVDAIRQIGLRNGLPSVLETAYRHCAHAACPVPCSIVKAIEVAAGLALPRDVSVRIAREESAPDPRQEQTAEGDE